MSRVNNKVVILNPTDPVPTDAQGGYAGGDSTAAAIGTVAAQALAAQQTIQNLTAAGAALPYGSTPTATITGVGTHKTINVGIPVGMPEDVGAALAADAAQSASAAAQSASDADAAVLLAQQAQAASLEVPDANVSALVGNPASQTRAAGDARWTPRTEVTERARQPINVANYGFSRASVDAAIAAVGGRGAGATLHFPAGVYDVGAGLNLSGKSYVITGEGAAGVTTTAPSGTVLHATTQNGPVLNLEGFIKPTPDFTGKVTFGGFMLKGSGVANTANSGLAARALNGVRIHDLVIRDTGGPCIDLLDGNGNSVYLCEFERITLVTPVSAGPNDVPYFRAIEANGNHFSRIGLISKLASGLTGDLGVSGAVVLKGGAGFAADDNFFDSWWVENLHMPTGSSVFAITGGNRNIISGVQWFDIKFDDGATGTAKFRILPHTSSAADYGGNQILGEIPGGYTALGHYGVDMQQSRNSVIGVKGNPGYNVRIAPGVVMTSVELGGAISSGAFLPSVVDESGQPSNYWHDASVNQRKQGTYLTDGRTPAQGGSGPRFSDTTNPNNGGVHLGQAGTRFSAIGTTRYDNADQIIMQNMADTGGPVMHFGAVGNPSIRSGSVNPEGAVGAYPGSIYMRTNGQVYVKVNSSTAQGWVALNTPPA